MSIDRLEQIGREITARVEKLDKLGGKAVDQVDLIDHLLGEAKKLCETAEAFETFKLQHCPDLGRSRTYELLAIKEGRKNLEDIRASTRARVAKHRADKKDVTDSSSVTLNGQGIDPIKLGAAAQSQITNALADSSKASPDKEPAEKEARRSAAARSHPRNASVSLKCFLNACYHYVPDLDGIEIEKAKEIFKQCAKEAEKRAEKRKTDPGPPPARSGEVAA